MRKLGAVAFLFKVWTGLRSTDDARNLKISEFKTCQNVLPMNPNELKTRLGWVRAVPIPTAQGPEGDVLSIYQWEEKDVLVFQSLSSTNMYDLIHTTGSVCTTIDTDVNEQYLISGYTSFGYGVTNYLYMAAHTKLWRYSKTGVLTNISLTHGAPKPKDVITRYDQLWTCGDNDNPSRVSRCDILDDQVWDGTGNSGYMDVSAGDGAAARYLVEYSGDLWVFKTGDNPSIWIIRGEPMSGYFLLSYLQNAPNALCKPIVTPQGIMFFAGGTVYLIAGHGVSAKMIDIAEQIKPDLANPHKMWENRPFMTMGYSSSDKTFWLVYYGFNNVGAVGWYQWYGTYNGSSFVWAKHVGWDLTCLFSGDEMIGVGSTSTTQNVFSYGRVWNEWVQSPADYDGTVAGVFTDIDCIIETAETDLGIPAIAKNARSFICDLNVDGTVTKTATAEIFTDGATTAAVTITINGIGAGKNRQRINLKFETIRAMLTWSQNADLSKLDRYGAEKASVIQQLGWDVRVLEDRKRGHA